MASETGTTPAKVPRGIRNNNPGNLRRTGQRWLGQSKVQTDPEFVRFTDPFFGLRALCKTLLTYQRTHNLRTVRRIITRYAPPVENQTAFYVTHVAKSVGVNMDAVVNLMDLGTLVKFSHAITQHENGQDPYPLELHIAAARAALDLKPPKPEGKPA